jgi:glycosyltransferase involved in cell wall biosynthesis
MPRPRRLCLPMHVGLNLIYLVPGETGGTETYARELVSALLTNHPQLRLTAFINRESTADAGSPWRDLVPTVTVPVNARRRSEWVRGEQQLLPALASRSNIDVLHSLANTAPLLGRQRRVVTIQDVIFRMYPETHTRARAVALRVLVPLAARRSHRIIASSGSTRDDLVNLFGVRSSKIDVVPLGLGTRTVQPTPEPQLRARLELGSRTVVLSASAKRPHKNLLRLIDALALIPRERRPVLILPGYPTPYEDELRKRAKILGLENDTRFVGWVSDGDIEGLYALAACFVFPSLYEGFGLPVLEAMARGVPVATTNRGALAEVAGNAALVFDPDDSRSIASAVERLITDRGERERLRGLGATQAARFTWEATAAGTVSVYRKSLLREPA